MLYNNNLINKNHSRKVVGILLFYIKFKQNKEAFQLFDHSWNHAHIAYKR